MKTLHIISPMAGALLVFAAATGCKSDYGAGSPYQPGPAAGKAVGGGVGTVAGNAAGFGVGVVQGTTHRCRQHLQSRISHGALLEDRDHAGRPHHPGAL